MFGWGRKRAVENRAKQIVRMVAFIKHGMRTQSYEQFLGSFSNPGDEPTPIQRYRREARFVMRMSRSCSYAATVSFANDADGRRPFISLRGAGNDFGVLIITDPHAEGATIDLYVESGKQAGRDAVAMVQLLQSTPNWDSFATIERELSGFI